jgi:integral membrane protein (TIGR01906 family)
VKIIQKILPILLITTFPLLFIITSIRLVLTPIFLEVEYRMPGFPDDVFGFTLEDRLTWSKISMNYLINDQGIDFLSDQYLPDGKSLYNERELNHMLDVKNLTQIVLKVGMVLAGIDILLLLLALKGAFINDFYQYLSVGGWVTIGFVFLIFLGVLVSFDTLFIDFHRIFFTGDTWLFYYSDSLIRLFPEHFWQDVFLTIGGLSILLSIGAILIGRRFSSTAKK